MFLCFNACTEVHSRIGNEFGEGLGPSDCVPIWDAHWAEERGNSFKTKLKKITFRNTVHIKSNAVERKTTTKIPTLI